MKCRNCGKEIPDDSAFCPECGEPVEQEPKAQTCPQCGAPLKPGAAFCSNCGFQLHDAAGKAASGKAAELQSDETQDNEPQSAELQGDETQDNKLESDEPQGSELQDLQAMQQMPDADETLAIPPRQEREVPEDGEEAADRQEDLQEPKALRCPQCGAPLKPGAAFCSNCGFQLHDAAGKAAPGEAAELQGDEMQDSETQGSEPQVDEVQGLQMAQQMPEAEKTEVIPPMPVREAPRGGKEQAAAPKKKAHRKHRGVAIAVTVALVACAVGGGVWWYKTEQDRMYRERTAEVSVPIDINAPNYTSDATRIPIRIQGTSTTGEEIDKTVYIGADDSSIDIAPGSYELTVVASPILKDGSLYQVPSDPVSLEVPENTPEPSIFPSNDEKRDDSTKQGQEQGQEQGKEQGQEQGQEQVQSPSITLTPITDQSTVTDEQIAAAKEAATSDPDDSGKAETLATTATSLRDEEVKEKAVGNLPSNFATGGYAVSDGTYDYFAAVGKGICRADIKTGKVETLASLGEDDKVSHFNLDGDKLFYVLLSKKVCCLDIPTGTISVIDDIGTGKSGSDTTEIVGLYEYGQELYEVIGTNSSSKRTYQVYHLGEDGSAREMVASYENKESVDYASPAPFVTRDGIVYVLNASKSASSIYSQPFGGTATKICDVSNGHVSRTPIVQDGAIYYSVQSGKSNGILHSIGLDGTGDQKLVEKTGTYDGVDLLAIVDGTFFIQGGDVKSGFKILRAESGSSSTQTLSLPSGYVIPCVQDAGDHLLLLDSDTAGRIVSVVASDYEGGNQVTYVTYKGQ